LIQTSAQLTFAGATISDLIETTTQYGLVTATGTCSAVGMAGHLGGGYSELTGAYGLGIDNLRLHKWSLPMGNF